MVMPITHMELKKQKNQFFFYSFITSIYSYIHLHTCILLESYRREKLEDLKGKIERNEKHKVFPKHAMTWD